jgi:Apea-like HEPN
LAAYTPSPSIAVRAFSMSNKSKGPPLSREVEKIAKSLRDLAGKADFPATSSKNSSLHRRDGIAFSLPKNVIFPPEDALSLLLARGHYKARFSMQFLGKKLSSLFCCCISDPRFQLEQGIQLLLAELDSFSQERRVFIRVEGVVLLGLCVDIGRVRLCPGDEHLVEEIAAAADRLIDLTLASEEEKDALKKEDRKRLSNRMKGACIAMIRLNAEPVRAIELAKEEVRRSLDLLRLGIKATHELHCDIRIGIAGDHPSVVVEAVALSDSSINTEVKCVGFPLRVDASFLNNLEQLGVFRVSKALAKNRCTNLEEAIITSVHWFSVASCQDDKSNAFLLLVVSLETLFKQAEGASIAGTVAEGAAFLLGQTKEQRLEISKLVRKFYRMRSSVAHSGRSSFTDIDLDRLMLIVLKVILEVVSRADRLCTQGDLDNEIQLMKFS